MELFGFVNLGNYTPKKDENQLGDHALVFMFQPFVGKGIQALACFLTKGNVTGEVQAKLVLECVVLCENAGLHIDVVTSDGATWNRAMWKHFGITDPLQPWCGHPVRSHLLLRFSSDWPHLIKCLRNLLMSRKIFVVPEGTVKHAHFDELVKHESTKEFRIAYKLTHKHVWPRNFEKMSAKLAFQLFSDSVAMALSHYRDEVNALSDSWPTEQFCTRMNRIIDIMNSSLPSKALKYDSDDYKELQSFLVYLDLWEQCSPPEHFLSKSTFDGLRATISCTLNLTEYLTHELQFKYLMTTRINQDALEHFFGMMRDAGGCNNHPESLQVGQLFRLLSIYSLVKPSRGSNVSGGEMLETLLNVKSIHSLSEKKPMHLTFNIVVEDDGGDDLLSERFTDTKEAFAYVCGFVASKFRNINCPECKFSVIGQGTEDFNNIIRQKSRGYLTYPSEKLYKFLMEVEMLVSHVFKNELRRNALNMVAEAIGNHRFKFLLGCQKHGEELTQNVLRHFIITRLCITCLKEARNRSSANKSKQYAKLAKQC